MILSYPTTVPTITITLRDPDLGNTERVVTNAIIRRTRSGELKTIDDWHDDIIQSFSFSVLPRAQRDYLEEFLEESAGGEIGLYWGMQIWRGHIISPQTEIITVRDSCSYSAAFEFRGRRLS